MKIFNWYAQHQNGQHFHGLSVHKTSSEAHDQLVASGYQKTIVKPCSKIQLYKMNQSVSKQHIYEFTHQLALMLTSGLTLIQALSHLAKKKHKMQIMLNVILSAVTAGMTLNEAMEIYPQKFNRTYIHLIHTGHMTGSLDLSLSLLAEQLKHQFNIKKKMQEAFVYPCFILFLSCLLGWILLIHILPQIQTMYHQAGADLPMLTQYIIYISKVLDLYTWHIISAPCVFTLFFCLAYRYQPFKYLCHIIVLYIPGVSQMMRVHIMMHCFRLLDVAQQCHLNLLDSIELAIDAHQNMYYKSTMIHIKSTLLMGQTFHHSIASTSFFNTLEWMHQLIDIGEKSGKMKEVIAQIAEIYQEKHQQQMTSISQNLQPTLMVFLSLWVGLLIFGMYLPIFSMADFIQS